MKLFAAALVATQVQAVNPPKAPAKTPPSGGGTVAKVSTLGAQQKEAPAVVCPLGWEAGEEDGECSPKNVEVTCNAKTMEVTFPIDAVYFHGSEELNEDQIALAKADVVAQNGEGCVDFEYDSDAKKFTVSHDLTACGTKAVHDADNHELVFSNSYTGDKAALTVDGILTTKVLSFKAECVYSDEATVSIDDVTISMGTNIAETVSQTGKYTFNMVTLDAAGDELGEDNKAEIGDQVTLKVTPSSPLPSNVEFHVVDCIAAEEFADSGEVAENKKSYSILKEGSCVSDLLKVQFDGDGKSNTAVSLDFNSFTFSAEEDELDIKCNLKLCLTNDADCVATVQEKDTENFECDAKYSRSSWFDGL